MQLRKGLQRNLLDYVRLKMLKRRCWQERAARKCTQLSVEIRQVGFHRYRPCVLDREQVTNQWTHLRGCLLPPDKSASWCDESCFPSAWLHSGRWRVVLVMLGKSGDRFPSPAGLVALAPTLAYSRIFCLVSEFMLCGLFQLLHNSNHLLVHSSSFLVAFILSAPSVSPKI